MSAETPSESEVVDEARSAAAGTRVAARWTASALAAIPSLAAIGSIVRDPGEGGFDSLELTLGVALAAAGAILGVLAYARVVAPIALEDKHLKNLDLKRIPGQPYESFDDLAEHVGYVRAAAVSDEHQVTRALQDAKGAETVALEREARAKEAEDAAKAEPGDQELAAEAAAAKAEAERARNAADAAKAKAESEAAGQKFWAEQLARAEAIRRDAYGLQAADEVGKRFTLARWITVPAAALIAAGIILLGLAPEPKPEKPAAAGITLLTLTLNDDGRTALGCAGATSVPALKTGGTDTAPAVITLPVEGCPSKTLTFRAEEPKALGRVTVVKPIEVGG